MITDTVTMTVTVTVAGALGAGDGGGKHCGDSGKCGAKRPPPPQAVFY